MGERARLQDLRHVAVGGGIEEQGVRATAARSATPIVTYLYEGCTILAVIFKCARILRIVIYAYHNPTLSRHAIDCHA
jgi:hypothetical protein